MVKSLNHLIPQLVSCLQYFLASDKELNIYIHVCDKKNAGVLVYAQMICSGLSSVVGSK